MGGVTVGIVYILQVRDYMTLIFCDLYVVVVIEAAQRPPTYQVTRYIGGG